jgi:hypothetical protein
MELEVFTFSQSAPIFFALKAPKKRLAGQFQAVFGPNAYSSKHF